MEKQEKQTTKPMSIRLKRILLLITAFPIAVACAFIADYILYHYQDVVIDSELNYFNLEGKMMNISMHQGMPIPLKGCSKNEPEIGLGAGQIAYQMVGDEQ